MLVNGGYYIQSDAMLLALLSKALFWLLGPLLFVIYLNDIDTCISNKEGVISKFADDTKLAKVVNNSETAVEMQEVIERIEKWSKDWGMQFNIK